MRPESAAHDRGAGAAELRADAAPRAPSAVHESGTFRVGGFVPFSTCDWPGRLTAVVFAQGCPWRCGYCHNAHLIAPRGDDERDWPRLLHWLRSRRGLLDGVVFSGGEPTAQDALPDAMRAVRDLGFAIGLHTAGAYPRRLARVLPLVDWIGLDIKASTANYAAVTGVRGSADSAFAALDAVCEAGVSFEVRTTVHPSLTLPADLEVLARELAARGITRWALQPFRPSGCGNGELVDAAPHGGEIARELLTILAEHVPGVAVRTG